MCVLRVNCAVSIHGCACWLALVCCVHLVHSWLNFIDRFFIFFFFKQKTAYEMRISDWSSDVCSSDLFNLMPPSLPGGIDDFVDHVIPVLQRRGLFRKDYETSTLRGHLGLGRPQTKYKSPQAQGLRRFCSEIGRALSRERVCQYL